MTTPAPAIDVRSFSFRIGRKEILREVSFSVAAGQYVSIVGPNGAGKTTLLKCLDAVLAGGTGRIEIHGRGLADYPRRELAKRVSYVPQADGPVPEFSVEQFVLMGRYPYLSPFSSIRVEDRRAVHAALERSGTLEFSGRMLRTLSGGERQKVYVAAALAQGADVLLLDEPTTFLDYRHQAEIRALLAGLNRECGATIIAVTHDLNVAVLESHQIVALCEGQVVYNGPPAQLMQAEVLQRIYGTPFLLVNHPEAPMPAILPRPAPDHRA
jgi:iron complex transport system ATP-binding protein